MSVYIGGHIPGFKFRFNVTNVSPRVLSFENNISITGHVIDTSVVTTTYSGAITGTQYNFQVVPEQYVLFGENPSVTFTTDNSGISTIDHLGNTTFVSTGEYRVIGSYVQNSFYEGLTVEYPIINYSGGGEVVLETQYINDPVNISNHVLIVYNSGTQTSTNLKHYYTGKRPHFSGANVLPLLNCPSGETISYSHFVTGIKNPIIDYLTGISGSKPIRYIVMMQDIPTRVIDTNKSSVSMQLYTAFKDNGLRDGEDYKWKNSHYSLGQFQGTTALISYINFGTYNDNIGYIDRICQNQTGIYLTGNNNITGYYFDDYQALYPGAPLGSGFLNALLREYPSLNYVYKSPQSSSHITTGVNVAGFCTWGANGGLGGNYANDGTIKWGNNNWYIMTTIESFNGRRITSQGNFIDWFSLNAFGGTGYENCPVGAVCHVEEPFLGGVAFTGFYLLWQRGWPFIEAAWQSRKTPYFLCLGDPLIKIT